MRILEISLGVILPILQNNAAADGHVILHPNQVAAAIHGTVATPLRQTTGYSLALAHTLVRRVSENA